MAGQTAVMSIKIMSAIWEHSEAKGTELLLLLAIADYANDKGMAWPSITTLARKCRMSRRYTMSLLQKLEAKGAIEIQRRVGIRGNNRYRVISPTGEPQVTSELDVTSEPQITSTGEPQFTSLVNPSSPDPSVTIIKPSVAKAKSVPLASPSKKRGKTKIPAAVKVFRSSAHRFPAKAWYADVAKAVGDEEADLLFWGDVVKAWVGLGWNPTNVKGMLEFYQDRKLPGADGRSGEHKSKVKGL